MIRKSWIFGIIIMVVLNLQVYAQQQNVWVFGSHAGINFNGNTPSPEYTAISSAESSASICDASGKLQFYTDGYYVWNKSHSLMSDGHSLTPFSHYGGSSTQSTSQGSVIIPFPGTPNKFYIFSLTQVEMGTKKGQLYFSVVDMELDNGNGNVVPTQRSKFLDSGLTEKMVAVAGNNCNIWLLVCTQSGVLKAFSITENGVDTTPEVSGTGMGYADMMVGTMAVSPDRSKLATTVMGPQNNANNGVRLFDFDINTAHVSNPINLLQGQGVYGACFAGGSKKLYITSAGKVIQFDLALGGGNAVAASATELGAANIVTAIKLAPNNKIYFLRKYNGQLSVLGAIEKPDQPGISCGYSPEVLTLKSGTAMSIGLPNSVPLLNTDTLSNKKKVAFACFKDSLTLVPSSIADQYLWNDGSTASTHTIGSSGMYIVKYQKACRYYVDSFFVLEPEGQLPGIETIGSCHKKENGKAWLAPTASGQHLSIKWFKDNTLLSNTDTLSNVPSGNYTLSITTPSGCDTQIQFKIPEIIGSATILADSIVCVSDSIHFNSTLPATATSWLWSLGDGGHSTLSQFNYAYSQPGTYDVALISEDRTCKDTTRLRINVDAPVTSHSFSTNAESICTGETVVLTSEPAGDYRITNRRWDFGDQSSLNTDEHTVSHAYDRQGTMMITLVTNFRACPALTFSDSILILPLPEIYLGPDTSICLGGEAILISNRLPDKEGDDYMWNTGDTGKVLTIKAPGKYYLSISSADNHCMGKDEIEISKNCYIDIPNAFTPNGDGVNDYFFPKPVLSGSLSKFQMRIFNRWGQKIFETTSTSGRGWDGKLNNTLQPLGVYIYQIEAEIDSKYEERYQGTVTLLQ